MFRIGICDDDRATQQLLQEYLEDLRAQSFEFKVLVFSNGYELEQYYQRGEPKLDLIILDMFMPKQNGVVTGTAVRRYDEEVPFIIVTSSREFAVECIEIGVISYLVKPLTNPVEKQFFLQKVRKVLQEFQNDDKGFFFDDATGSHKVKFRDIYYFESNLHEIRMVCRGVEHRFKAAISQVAQELRDRGFARVHKSFVVNMEKVKDLTDQELQLENKESLPVSKHRRKELRELWRRNLAGGPYGS